MSDAARTLKNCLVNGPYERIDSLLPLLEMEQRETFPLLLKQTQILSDGSVQIPPFLRDDSGDATVYSDYSFWKILSLMRDKPLWFYRIEFFTFSVKEGNEPFRLPEGLRFCPSLKGLSLADIGLRDFPEELLELRRLRYIELNRNRLKSLPPGIVKYRQLVYFNAADNELEQLPDQLGRLKKLKILDLSGNNLKSIDFSLEGLLRLNELDLSGNSLQTVPAGLEQLNQLERVDLSFNDLSAQEEAAWESGYTARIKNYQWHLPF